MGTMASSRQSSHRSKGRAPLEINAQVTKDKIPHPDHDHYPDDYMQVHRSDTPTGLELGSPPASPVPPTTLAVDVMSDSSEFDKYKDFPMEATEMYARIDKLKGFRRSKSPSESKRRRWGLPKKVKPAEKENDTKKDQTEMAPEEKSVRKEKVEVDGREGIRKAFSSVLNLLSQPQVSSFYNFKSFLPIVTDLLCFFEPASQPMKLG